MKTKVLSALICVWFALLAFGAGWQGLLRLDNIVGESADPNHPGWMDVWASTPTQLRSTNGLAITGDLAFQKNLDKASPALALACAQGNTINSGTLDLVSTDSRLTVFLRLNLTNITLTGVTVSGSGTDLPEEQITLHAQVFSWNYTQFSPTNGLAWKNASSRWDFAANTGEYAGDTPSFVSTGIRKNNGVELSWDAAVGASYRIYAVSNLAQPFTPIVIVTNARGRAVYSITSPPQARPCFTSWSGFRRGFNPGHRSDAVAPAAIGPAA